ncbi:hypothetical protein KO500_14475 [Cellulophaga baltica]|uniref:hypothetical protein n=1 Tax=Cellulophaga TaxID=104264 RepID=UPI001C07EBA5|nr:MULTISPECIES: hypothetical protein [Cellulophaga]MBU2997652.1 hypothetical protein [Cellulophaga baltica]MDO6769047.1 hypothetical protein [Cellulophaga sp. 1_MG-2023]
MKKVLSSCSSTFNFVCCSIFGHHYTVSRNVTSHIKEYKCIHCDKQVSTDADGNISVLTAEMKEINRELENIHSKRHIRTSHQQVA